MSKDLKGKKLSKIGILLINLGTPAGPDPKSVGRYLGQFLMDPYVIPLPWLLRWILVKLLIIPKRKYSSSALYSKIWGENGSPLLDHSIKLSEKLAEQLGEGYEVTVAMRYGQPSIQKAVGDLSAKVSRMVVVPLYPQFADSTVKTCLVDLEKAVKKLPKALPFRVVEPFYDQPFFIEAQQHLLQAQVANTEQLEAKVAALESRLCNLEARHGDS